MKKLKIFMSVLLSIALVVTISPITHAKNIEELITEDMSGVEENHTDDSSVSPRYNCGYCGSSAQLKCYGEKLMYERSTHKPLFKDTCTVFHYWSTSAHVCRNCKSILADYGYHDCEEIHVGCGAGTVNVCSVASDIS